MARVSNAYPSHIAHVLSQGSHPQPAAWQTNALPTELLKPVKHVQIWHLHLIVL